MRYHDDFNPGDTECVHIRRSNDHGKCPFVVNIKRAVMQNNYFRTALWTGNFLQLTLMCIKPGEDIGAEVHCDTDQFLRVECGQGVVMMGLDRNNCDFRRRVAEGDVILVPAGYWHNLVNTGRMPLKLYSIYAPPEHKFGTVHLTRKEGIHH